jgi:hypothetical protein
MSEQIDHFMWGYQCHFRISKEIDAKTVFGRIDKRFEPEVFLVGVLIEDRIDRYQACVEPEKDFWIQSKDFNKALELAKKIRPSYPESGMMQSHPLAQEWQDDELTRRSIADAIQQIINDNNKKPSHISYFVSQPSKLYGYIVCIVLGLQTSVLESYPSLKNNRVPLHECRDIAVSTSFIDAAVTTYLEKASVELNLPNPGLSLSGQNADETLRSAANRLMTDLAYRACPFGEAANETGIGGWYVFFSLCNGIASAYYEKSVASGMMILAKKDHTAIKTAIKFTHPTELGLIRGARKLLQLSSKKLALHTDSKSIYGLVEERGYSEEEENLFKIRFIGHYHWEVAHTNRVLMKVKYGQPYLPKPPFNIAKFRKDLPRIFGKMTEKHINRILDLIHEAEKEKHGTLLLITKAAKIEAERLRTQCTPIKPKRLTTKMLRNLTPIDGAVVLNPKGTCYAVGAILDGLATEEGAPSRGARYNSAIRYRSASKHPCMLIVISEDGGVDFIPDLKPAIKQSQIEDAIAELKQINNAEQINHKKYNRTMEWLDKHRFYLLKYHCIEINKLKKLIYDKKAPGKLIINWSDFTPNSSLDISLYYEN